MSSREPHAQDEFSRRLEAALRKCREEIQRVVSRDSGFVAADDLPTARPILSAATQQAAAPKPIRTASATQRKQPLTSSDSLQGQAVQDPAPALIGNDPHVTRIDGDRSFSSLQMDVLKPDPRAAAASPRIDASDTNPIARFTIEEDDFRLRLEFEMSRLKQPPGTRPRGHATPRAAESAPRAQANAVPDAAGPLSGTWPRQSGASGSAADPQNPPLTADLDSPSPIGDAAKELETVVRVWPKLGPQTRQAVVQLLRSIADA